MSALGIGMTDKEELTTWGNLHTSHPETAMRALSLSAWKLAASLADEEEPDWPLVEKLQALAKQMEELDQDDWMDEAIARDREWSLQHEEERP